MKPSPLKTVDHEDVIFTNSKYYLCNFISFEDAKKFFKYVGWPLEELSCTIAGTVPIYINVDKTIAENRFIYYELEEIQWYPTPPDELNP